MPPRPTAQRRSTAQSEAFHELGVRGRKTGVSLKDTGVRDEHGMQPLDDVFSSPDKSSQNGVEEHNDDEEGDESDEEPMDIDETTGPAPSAFMRGSRFPPAHARSPPKTNLQSPAKRNPHLGHSSSPTRGSIVRHSQDRSESPRSSPPARGAQRKLDFKNKPSLANGVNGNGKAPAVTNGHLSPAEEDEGSQPDEESLAILDGNEDYAVEEEEGPQAEEAPEVDGDETEEELPPPAATKPRGRPKKSVPIPSIEEDEPIVQSVEEDEGQPRQSIEEDAGPAEEDEPARAPKKRGRPPKAKAAEEDAAEQPKKKKTKRDTNIAEDEAQPARGRKPGAKKTATEASEGRAAASKSSAPAAKKAAVPKQKRAGRPRKSEGGVGDTSVAEVPRGPPLPKSRGLMITRRETPAGFTTRSGRTSFQPLKFWRNERVELDGDEVHDDGKQHVLLPRIREIVRFDEPEPDPKAAAGRRGKKGGGGRRKAGRPARDPEDDDDDDDDDAELEPWEQDGDIITGEVVVWQPGHELNPPGPDEQIEVAEEQIAVSAGAIATREIRNASFRFAKTLSTPFFGAGVVDLPPRSEKKPKNARKMHMSFFVFSGRVQVTVADTTFTIGKGGMWFVPRGNYYSIENDSDKPARVMFSQGCEVSSAAAAGENSMVR